MNKMNKEIDFELVRIILRSKKFREELSVEDKDRIFNEIKSTGISDQELDTLISQIRQEEISLKANYYNLNKNYIENLPYDIFVKMVELGNITGRDLINLCDTSDRINYYCNKDLILSNGLIYNQVLFRRLLSKNRIRIPSYNKLSPKELYERHFVGKQVFAFGCNNYGQLGLGNNEDKSIPTLIPNFSNIIQISLCSDHTLMLNDKVKFGFLVIYLNNME